MLDAIKNLIDSGILNEDAKTQIAEAWESKLAETRQEIVAEMRSEFSNRYEHDKEVMVEALEKLVDDSLTEEITKISEERSQLVKDRARFMESMIKKSKTFDSFLGEQLKKEINEFVKDRNLHSNAVAKLEKFVVRALAEELTEFAEDKKDLVNTKVKLVSEAKTKLDELRKQFVQRGSKLVEESVAKALRGEIGQLKEDIKVARENNFGRKLFEAFSSEFSATYLNENAEIKKLRNELSTVVGKLEEATETLDEKSVLIETKDREINKIKNNVLREKKINELVKPLGGEKAAVMMSLLESVNTDRLDASFEKYLPAVMNNKQPVKNNRRETINESVRKNVTGDRTARVRNSDDDEDKGNIIEIRRLAGLK